ncbi:MAG: AI-2E family transporter [Lachnospiraceae bacterium]|nr:AI-2E family transporter [Lachnospiraceae bacterium]
MEEELKEDRDGEIKKDRRRGGSWKKYAGYGITAFLVLAASVLLVFMFVQREEFGRAFQKIRTAAAPAIYGAVFAYLMNPLMVFFEEKLKNLFYKRAKNITKANKAARTIAIIITVIVVILLIGFLMYMLIPELTATVTGLVRDLPAQYRNLTVWYEGLEIRHTQIGVIIDKNVLKAGEYIESFINNLTVSDITDIVKPVLSGAKNVFGVLYNTFIGLIFSIYILGYKEKLAGITKKVIYSIFKRKPANVVIRISRQCHFKFTTSFTGKMIDSVVVGLICFLFMLLFKFPYAVLISVIIGVTNVIPFFGPIIGAVPSAILILFVNPLQCLYFIIMVIVLQQLDANVLTPKIVGDSIGLSPIWVLFACVFFGGLWGVIGMLLAVPLMACIYMIVKEIVEYRLYRKGLDLDTDYYESLEYENETEVIRLGSSAELGTVSADSQEKAEKPEEAEEDALDIIMKRPEEKIKKEQEKKAPKRLKIKNLFKKK